MSSLTNKVKMRSDSSKHRLGAGEPSITAESLELSKQFPLFVLVLRDFFLEKKVDGVEVCNL